MDDASLSVQDLFWLEQEELDMNDNFFMPADTPPNCAKAYQHRRRMCKDSYDRVLTRLIQKQTQEMNDLRSSLAQSMDDALLPEKSPGSYHHYISGQQYVRENQALFKEALEFVMQNGNSVEENTPSITDMITKDDAAMIYRRNCQAILDNATRVLRMKHQVQRNQILLQSVDALQKIIDEQNQEPEASELSPPTRRMELSSTTPIYQQPQLQLQQRPQQQLQQQQHEQQQQMTRIHSINSHRDPRVRSAFSTTSRK